MAKIKKKKLDFWARSDSIKIGAVELKSAKISGGPAFIESQLHARVAKDLLLLAVLLLLLHL